MQYLEATELKRARWLSRSIFHVWKRSPPTVGYLQAEIDALALEIGDYLEAINIVFRRFARRHVIKEPYMNETDVRKLFDTLRPPSDTIVDFRKVPPVANACVEILTSDNPNSIAYYVASRMLGLEVDFEPFSLLTRLFGEPEGCTSAVRIRVATEPIPNADLVLMHGKGTGYPVRTEHTAYIFQLATSNIPVPIDPVPHALFLHPPFPCRPEELTDSQEPTYRRLLPGTSMREAFISRDSILIPSFSGRVIHWWLSRPLTYCEVLQAKGFPYEIAKQVSEYNRKYLRVEIDPMTAKAQILTFLRMRGIPVSGAGDGNYTV